MADLDGQEDEIASYQRDPSTDWMCSRCNCRNYVSQDRCCNCGSVKPPDRQAGSPALETIPNDGVSPLLHMAAIADPANYRRPGMETCEQCCGHRYLGDVPCSACNAM